VESKDTGARNWPGQGAVRERRCTGCMRRTPRQNQPQKGKLSRRKTEGGIRSAELGVEGKREKKKNMRRDSAPNKAMSRNVATRTRAKKGKKRRGAGSAWWRRIRKRDRQKKKGTAGEMKTEIRPWRRWRKKKTRQRRLETGRKEKKKKLKFQQKQDGLGRKVPSSLVRVRRGRTNQLTKVNQQIAIRRGERAGLTN